MTHVRGWGPWKQIWYSICSAHRDGGPNDACDRCRMGLWRNNWARIASSTVYKVSPRFWRWWVNR